MSKSGEFRTDAGSAVLVGKGKMIAALEKLQRHTGQVDSSHASIQSLKISGKSSGILALFATHPPLADRIAALRDK